jgi:hypothetical protein
MHGGIISIENVVLDFSSPLGMEAGHFVQHHQKEK